MKTKIFFGGDVVLAEGTVKGDLCSERLQDRISKCEIVCCNFEAPVAEGINPKKKIGPNNRNGKESIVKLSEAGFNLVTLANNHIFDYGIDGMTMTIELLSHNGITTIGAGIDRKEIYKPYIFSAGDTNIGIVNMAENGFGASNDAEDTYGYSYIFSEQNRNIIKELKEKCSVIIAVCHAGAEMWDFPLPEWRSVYRKMVEDGVDIVVAHHPHVPQGWEEYQDGYIFYSLGNLAFDKGKGAKRPETYCVEIDIIDGKISYEIIPTIFRNGMIDINDSEEFKTHLDYCCKLLTNEEKYIDEVNQKSLQMYQNVYQRDYGKIVCNYRGSMKEWLKGIVKRRVFRIKFQDIWLYHNIAIETHLYICKRASRLILKQKNIL